MKSLVMILPAAQRQAGDDLSAAFGHADPGVSIFSAPLSPSGQSPVTHYGCHTWATDQFIADLDAAQAGALSPLPTGVDAQALSALITAMIRSARPVDAEPYAHFADVLAANGLMRMQLPVP